MVRQSASTAPPPRPTFAGAGLKLAVTAAIFGYYLVGYFTLNRYPFARYHEVPTLPVVDELPFIGWTLWIYNSVFIYCTLAIWLLPDARAARRYLLAVLAAYTLNFAAFALFPTAMERGPLPTEGSPWWLWLAHLTRGVDAPHTCLPSLHVASCAVVVIAYWRTRLRWPFLAWALAITFTTLTTRQHLFLDLPTGALVGLAGAALGRWLGASRHASNGALSSLPEPGAPRGSRAPPPERRV